MCRLESLPNLRIDREGEAKVEGKIEARGTRRGVRPGLHVGWSGTRLSERGAPNWVKYLEILAGSRALRDGLRWSFRRGPV